MLSEKARERRYVRALVRNRAQYQEWHDAMTVMTTRQPDEPKWQRYANIARQTLEKIDAYAKTK